MKFHNSSTWHELDAWVNHLGVDSMSAIRRLLLAGSYDESGQRLRLNQCGKIR